VYDIIGDIHGYADELTELLERLGYDRRRGHYSHPDRKAVFVGDFIDRGPQILEVLQTNQSPIPLRNESPPMLQMRCRFSLGITGSMQSIRPVSPIT